MPGLIIYNSITVIADNISVIYMVSLQLFWPYHKSFRLMYMQICIEQDLFMFNTTQIICIQNIRY